MLGGGHRGRGGPYQSIPQKEGSSTSCPSTWGSQQPASLCGSWVKGCSRASLEKGLLSGHFKVSSGTQWAKWVNARVEWPPFPVLGPGTSPTGTEAWVQRAILGLGRAASFPGEPAASCRG